MASILIPPLGGGYALPNDLWEPYPGSSAEYIAGTDRWRRSGHPSVFPDGLWLPELEEPSLAHFGTNLANVGSLSADQLTLDGTTTTISTGGGTTIKNTYFSKPINLQANVNFYNCYFAGSNPNTGGSTPVGATLMHTVSGLTGFTADRCTFRPSTPNNWTHGVYGHHGTFKRSAFLECKDGARPNNQNSGATRVDDYFLGCLFAFLAFTYPDSQQSAGDGSHNDCIQYEGPAGLWVQGCSMLGMIRDMTYNAQNSIGNSGAPQPGPLHGRNGQGVIIQATVAAISDCHVLGNWFYGQSWGIKWTGSSLGDTEVKRNKFSRDPNKGLVKYNQSPSTAQGGALPQTYYQPMRAEAGTVVNGATMGPALTGIVNCQYPSALSDNVWLEDGTPAPMRIEPA